MPWIDGSIAHLQQSIDVTDYQHLWEASRRDELTMLPNRRAGMTKLDAELERVVTDDIPLSVALVDMNLLKHINDNHSHAEGDRALRLTGGSAARRSGRQRLSVSASAGTNLSQFFREKDITPRHCAWKKYARN